MLDWTTRAQRGDGETSGPTGTGGGPVGRAWTSDVGFGHLISHLTTV